jgi:mono/diheme cytochrome c family protein
MDERMRRTDALILAAFFSVLAPVAAFASDAAAGKVIASKWCAECHLVAADQGRAPTVAPAFATIAKRPGFDSGELAIALLVPHPRMPGLELSRDQAADIAAYIATLAK